LAGERIVIEGSIVTAQATLPQDGWLRRGVPIAADRYNHR